MSNKGSGGKQEAGAQPIIIKRIKKGGGHGHHGGAWKVAYADFVTAMMAFFLLLWLLNATTEEQKRGISNYFAPIAIAVSQESGSDGVLAGKSPGQEGVQASPASQMTVFQLTGVKDPEGQDHPPETRDTTSGPEMNQDELAKKMDEIEEKAFKKAEDQLKHAIDEQTDLKNLADNLVIDRVPEGLRIQLVDQAKVEMFTSGSAIPLDHTVALLKKVADVIKTMPNRISISGHTDAIPFGGRANYGNWELSADRANASRRILTEAGFPIKNIVRVEGKAETDPFYKDNPNAPTNRRISIVLLKESLLRPMAKAKPVTPKEIFRP
jgi:chemotaxis protein MotB